MSYWSEDRKKAERAVQKLVELSQQQRAIEHKLLNTYLATDSSQEAVQTRRDAMLHRAKAQAYEHAIVILQREYR